MGSDILNIAKQTKIKVVKFTLIFSGLISVLLALFFDFSVLFGFLVGLVVSLINFNLLYISLNKAVQYENSFKAGAYAFIHYLIRYSFWFIILYISFMRDDVSLIATVVGIMSVKLTIVVGNLFSLWDDQADIIRKEES